MSNEKASKSIDENFDNDIIRYAIQKTFGISVGELIDILNVWEKSQERNDMPHMQTKDCTTIFGIKTDAYYYVCSVSSVQNE